MNVRISVLYSRHTVYMLLNELSAKQSVFVVVAVTVVDIDAPFKKSESLCESYTHTHHVSFRTLFLKVMLDFIFKSVAGNSCK